MAELDRQCRFAHAAGTEHHDFVLLHADSLADGGIADEDEQQVIQRCWVETAATTTNCSLLNARNLEEEEEENKTPASGNMSHLRVRATKMQGEKKKVIYCSCAHFFFSCVVVLPF